MASRKGIGIYVLGVVIALAGLIARSAIDSASSYKGPRQAGTTSENFLSWWSSGQGYEFSSLLLLVLVAILIFCVIRILNRSLGAARRETLPDDEIEPLPEKRESEQK